MHTEIHDEGRCLRLVFGANNILVNKDTVKTVDVIKDTILRLDIGEGALKNIYLTAADVNVPSVPEGTAVNLQMAILEMLRTGIAQGGTATGNEATATNQTEQISRLDTVVDLLDQIKIVLSSDGALRDPSRVDESEPGIIYNGYAPAGTANDTAAWAIQRVRRINDEIIYDWADGDSMHDNVWNDRKMFTYLPLSQPRG